LFFAADQTQTFAYYVGRAHIVTAVFVGRVSDKHGVSTYRHFYRKFLALTQELCSLQTSINQACDHGCSRAGVSEWGAFRGKIWRKVLIAVIQNEV